MKQPTFVINIDPQFTPLINKNVIELAVNNTTFPGGEPHVYIKDLPQNPGSLVITHRYKTAADLVIIVLAHDAAVRAGFTDIELILPYFPGARQDRVCNPGESLTVRVFADIINSCGFKNVHIYSPHSEVTPALLNNVKLMHLDNKFLCDIITGNQYNSRYNKINVVCPDAGAGKRVASLAKFVSLAFPELSVNLIRCEKVRDIRTGALLKFIVQADDLNKNPTIICDDIVAYGGTFKGLGELLRKKNCGELILFTSHADCIDGIVAMSKYFDQVYTSNSKADWILPSDMPHNFVCFKITK